MTSTAIEADFAPLHQAPAGWRDRFALRLVKLMRVIPDTFFANRYGHRAVVLETVAAVPGMVGGLLQHLKAIRHIREDEAAHRDTNHHFANEIEAHKAP